MSRVSKVAEVGANRPLCVAPVKVSAVDTITRRGRAHMTERLGIPIGQCGNRADFVIDGQPLCRSHAGARSLEILLAQGA